MCDLDRRNASLSSDEMCDMGQCRDVPVAPDPEVLGSDAAFRRHCGGFGKHYTRTADGAAGEVYEMPIIGEPVGTGILAHRGDGDTIRQRNAADGEGVEKGWHQTISLLDAPGLLWVQRRLAERRDDLSGLPQDLILGTFHGGIGIVKSNPLLIFRKVRLLHLAHGDAAFAGLRQHNRKLLARQL